LAGAHWHEPFRIVPIRAVSTKRVAKDRLMHRSAPPFVSAALEGHKEANRDR
jgi:hypothetical protein